MRGATIALALLAAGCQLAAEVLIEQGPGGTAFTVDRSGKPGCMDGLTVHPEGGYGRDAMWEANAPFDGPCVSRIVYGRLGPGLSQAAPAKPLVPGKRYDVTATGTGFNDKQTFTAQ